MAAGADRYGRCLAVTVETAMAAEGAWPRPLIHPGGAAALIRMAAIALKMVTTQSHKQAII